MSNRLVNINGEMVSSEDQAKISVFDRGFLYGDSLYEVLRTYRRRPFLMPEHLVRLRRSAEMTYMDLSHDDDHYRQEVERSLATFFERHPDSDGNAYCRIILTRGVGRIGFGKQMVDSPTQCVIIVQPHTEPTRDAFERGLSLAVVERIRNPRVSLDPAAKTGNYLNSLLAFLEASEQGAEDALLCDSSGHVTEGTTFNVFYVKRGIVVTSPTEVGILHGLTRDHVLRLSRDELKLPVRVVRFPKERLFEADEVFVTSTLKEVFPVTRLNGKRIGDGRPGPITRKLAQSFRSWAENQCQK